MRTHQFLKWIAGWLLVAGLCLAEGAEADVRRDETVRAVARVLPSVVNISTKTVVKRQGFLYNWFRDNWAPFQQQLPPEFSAGSGVIIDEEGFLVTNVHVVEDATEIVVTLSDKRSYPADLVIGTRKSDVALLKLRSKPGEKFQPIQFAADDDLLLGETVLALGNPFGLGASVSKGILSAKTRRTKAEDGILDMEDWIQTDAAINPGNSGGPLVNLEGSLIGLNVAIFKEGQGIGFAIPVKRVSESLSEIFTPENVRSLWLGADFSNTTNGITVTEVRSGSPAERGGLAAGDIILKVGGVEPKNVFALNREFITTGDRKDIQLSTRRGRERRTATVRLVPESNYFNAKLIKEKLGIIAREFTAKDGARMGLTLRWALLITGIEQGSPADMAGLQQGLIIEAIDSQALESVVSAAKIVAGKKKGAKATLTLIVPGPYRRALVDVKVR